MGEALVLLNPIKRINIGDYNTQQDVPSSAPSGPGDSRMSNMPLAPVGVISVQSKDIQNEN